MLFSTDVFCSAAPVPSLNGFFYLQHSEKYRQLNKYKLNHFHLKQTEIQYLIFKTCFYVTAYEMSVLHFT